MIQAENLTKVYRIADKEPGLGGAVRHLFRPRHKSKTAVKDVSFTMLVVSDNDTVKGKGKMTP